MAEPDRGSAEGMPRWVKVFGIIALLVIVLFVGLLLTGGGHGPARHTSPGAAGGQMPSPAAAR